MIKNLAITPPVVGRISIGRVVEKNGRRLPEKDDQFTLTTQIQTREGWLPHPLDAELRDQTETCKLRSIPVTLPFNDPELNLRADYTFFDRKSGRPLCTGDGENARRHTANGLESLACPTPERCEFGAHDLCKPYARLYVQVDDEDADALGCFVFRTTGYNSIRTLAARLRYYQAVSGGHLAALPLALRLRGKSTTQSHGTPIYYVDLTTRDGQSLEAAIEVAQQLAEARRQQGLDQEALDQAAQQGFEQAPLGVTEEEGMSVVEEFYSGKGNQPLSPEAQPLSEKLVESGKGLSPYDRDE